MNSMCNEFFSKDIIALPLILFSNLRQDMQSFMILKKKKGRYAFWFLILTHLYNINKIKS